MKLLCKAAGNSSFNIIKTPDDDLSVFCLNKSKLKRIFNSHCWKTIDGVPIIDFNECLKILKRLNVYPKLITNYDLKLVFSRYCDQTPSQLQNIENYKVSHSGSISSIKESNCDQISLKQFENLFLNISVNKYDQIFAFMNQGCKEHYGFSFHTKNSKILTKVSSKDSIDSSVKIKYNHCMKTPNQISKCRNNRKMRISELMNNEKIRTSIKKQNCNRLINFDSKPRLDVDENNDFDNNLDLADLSEKFRNIDTSKQVIIKAGSIQLDSCKGSSRSNSRLRSSQK